MGFASDPAILIALGLASGDLDPEVVAAYLAWRDLRDGRTAFRGLRRVGGGRWVSFDVHGRTRGGRWFRPEEVAEEGARPEEFAEAVAEAVVAAVTSRARGRRAALALSGGRDSGSIAVALGRAGLSVTCLTQTFEPDLGCSEEGPALQIAEASGHRWVSVPVPSTVTEADLRALPAASGTPLGFPAFPLAFSLRDAAAAAGAEVFLDGQGGEPLFSAAPVAVLDLVRAGRWPTALRAARGFHRSWTYEYPVLAKAAVRALLPRRLIEMREALRPIPPWVAGPVPRDRDPATAPRSARAHLVRSLVDSGMTSDTELWERVFQAAGVEYASPLLDLRVVRLALALPVGLRVPAPSPKPVLASGLLDGFGATRQKARFTSYFGRLAESLRASFPWAFGPRSLLVERAFVRGEGLHALGDRRWGVSALGLVPPEMWLRRERTGE